ncbi:PAS domain S-box protein [Paenibacillus albicereus]|uniref:histidine kinase n=1 Tax=Paenibacillus albicereus TaxID=2726185 RepID=A0A6H2H241_9BACL|nr:ATP-binding protein [Paenibacillus albicereus]QJC53717.1 PAS domain S-box protein [Paenibacillus albicereus]
MKPFLTIDHLLYLLLAFIIMSFSSYTMLSMAGGIQRARPGRLFWLAGAAAVFSLGAWSMHFVGMLAYDYVISVGAMTILPLFMTGGAALFALSFLLRSGHPPSILRQLTAASILAASLLLLHLMCLLAHHAGHFRFDPIYIAAGALSFLGATVAAFHLHAKYGGKFRPLCSLLLASGALSLHVLALAGTIVSKRMSPPDYRLGDYVLLMGLLLALAVIVIFAFSIIAWVADRRYGLINERYRLIVENSIDAIAVISGYDWEFINRSGQRMFEIENESEMVGRSIYQFLYSGHHERMSAYLRPVLRRHGKEKKRGESPPIELDWVTAKGRLINTEVILSESTFAGKPIVVVIIRDISERKKNEELLINSEKLYVAGQLAAGIAHEIRNPLTSLKGFLQLMASGRSTSSHYFDIMKSELSRIEMIVSELLMLSKPQVYEMDFADVRVMMLDTALLLESQAALYGIEIKADYGQEPLWIYGVDSQIKQVFINVLKNAIEVMQDGGEIEIRLRAEDDEAVISVTDGGPGIDEEQLSKMGQPFYTTKDKGTGLGLMVSYKIVDNHKGRIRVSSELGIGTTFEIRLPCRSHSVRSAFREPESGASAG